MSLYLFILCAEVLTRLNNLKVDEKKIRGVKLSREGPELSHNLFADDLVLFGRASKAISQEISAALDMYYDWFGQKDNSKKSCVYFSKNTVRQVVIEINSILGF